jgi:hypothetical protein
VEVYDEDEADAHDFLGNVWLDPTRIREQLEACKDGVKGGTLRMEEQRHKVETHTLGQMRNGKGPPVQGTIQLKAYVKDLAYEASTGKQALTLEVVRAVSLASADKGTGGKKGSSDPFAKIWWDGRPAGQTEVVFNKKSPTWEETFTIPLQQNWQKRFSELKIEIFDSDEMEQDKRGKVSKVMKAGKSGASKDAADGDDFLGQAVLTSEDVLRMANDSSAGGGGAKKQHEFKLQPQPGQKSKLVKGSVFLRAAVVNREKSRKQSAVGSAKKKIGDCVRVQICSAKSIKKADRTGESDPYAIIILETSDDPYGVGTGAEQGGTAEVVRTEIGATSVVQNTANPQWKDEVFLIPVPETTSQSSLLGKNRLPMRLHVELYDEDPKGRGDFLGRITLEPDDLGGLPKEPPVGEQELKLKPKPADESNSDDITGALSIKLSIRTPDDVKPGVVPEGVRHLFHDAGIQYVAHWLQLSVVSANDLASPNVPKKGKKKVDVPDPFVIISCASHGHSPNEIREVGRTAIVEDSRYPLWSGEHFAIPMPYDQRFSELKCEVFDYNPKGECVCLGVVEFMGRDLFSAAANHHKDTPEAAAAATEAAMCEATEAERGGASEADRTKNEQEVEISTVHIDDSIDSVNYMSEKNTCVINYPLKPRKVENEKKEEKVAVEAEEKGGEKKKGKKGGKKSAQGITVTGSLGLRLRLHHSVPVLPTAVQVISANGLAAADKGDSSGVSKSDPYVELLWCGARLGRTRALENTVDPMWDETFYLPIPVKEQHSCQLALRIVDSDGVGASGEFLGQHVYTPDELQVLREKKPTHKSLERSRTIELEKQSSGRNKFVQGTLTTRMYQQHRDEDVVDLLHATTDGGLNSMLGTMRRRATKAYTVEELHLLNLKSSFCVAAVLVQDPACHCAVGFSSDTLGAAITNANAGTAKPAEEAKPKAKFGGFGSKFGKKKAPELGSKGSRKAEQEKDAKLGLCSKKMLSDLMMVANGGIHTSFATRIELALHALRLLHQLLVQGAVHATAAATAATVVHSIRLQKERERQAILVAAVAVGGAVAEVGAVAAAADVENTSADAAVDAAGAAADGTGAGAALGAAEGAVVGAADVDTAASDLGASSDSVAADGTTSAEADPLATDAGEGSGADEPSSAQGKSVAVPRILTEAQQQEQLEVKLGRVNGVLLRALDGGVLKVLLSICKEQAHLHSMVSS